MARCCLPAGSEVFDERVARRDLRRYRRKGLDPTARLIVDALRASGSDDLSVLEVGGGIGAIQLELLRAGAAITTNVELSPGYEAVAEELLEEAGYRDRVCRLVGDFTEPAQGIVTADAVVMHRVVCCYPDGETLVRSAADHARRFLFLSIPRDSWWMRAGAALQNGWHRLRGRRFRLFVHRPDALLAAARGQGLVPVLDRRGPIWQLIALEAVEQRPLADRERALAA